MMQPQMSVAGMMQPQVVDAASQLQMLQQQQLQQQQLQQLRPGLMPGMVPGLPMQQLVPAVSSVGMIPGMAVPGIPGLAAQPQLLARPQMIGIPGAQQAVLGMGGGMLVGGIPGVPMVQ